MGGGTIVAKPAYKTEILLLCFIISFCISANMHLCGLLVLLLLDFAAFSSAEGRTQSEPLPPYRKSYHLESIFHRIDWWTETPVG